ncbi:hypothetical protein LuPra_05505 [Luteitalea pratensis]|uniref:DUF4142 domain-containing protein n=1 Tax=Luteitalea pratensis TaxID=1855912 RepID=A0A143PUH5_LUTPR|nr:hypothetical protein [Luteitalea pratensis]AMY12232.1 hypothetical protein LuPra_05505 [Luteitalea pratensis]
MSRMPSVASALGVVALLITSAGPALAGPPLICHPFDIGTAQSLPFGDTQNGWSAWQATLPSYDRSKLVDDTLALLTPRTPVIVRMETLRRASAYSVDDKAIATRLLSALEARTTKMPKTPAEGLASFDYGYLVETYRQLGQRGVAVKATIDGVDGYALVKAALAQMPNDAGIQFAAALITESPATRAQHAEHLQKAKEMAKSDALVARNVATHFAN